MREALDGSDRDELPPSLACIVGIARRDLVPVFEFDMSLGTGRNVSGIFVFS
jgi:hypothetical protein